MKTVNKRLRDFLDQKNIKQEDLRKLLHLRSQVQISNWLTDEEPLPDKHIPDILRYYSELNANWLINGTGNMLNNMYQEKSQQSQDYVSDDPVSVKMYSCQDCLLRERIIKCNEETIAAQGQLIEQLQLTQKKYSSTDKPPENYLEEGKVV
jgi:transcriptional regulator with XRE-family HTH domain